MSDYDNAPTNPHHGGKMMPHQMPQRIEELEAERDEAYARELIAADAAVGYLEERDRLAELVRRAQDLIDPCYPDTCKAWQDDARAALNPYMRHTRAAAKRALDTGRNSDG